MILERHMGDYTFSTDKHKLDVEVIHGYLVTCYWAKGIPKETVMRSIEHSLCFGVYLGQEQVGFSRVITDYTTFMYLADVFILEAHRGKGLSVAMMDMIVNHPELQGISHLDATNKRRSWALREIWLSTSC
ncbi:MAG: GNAT family N-acetyltransferase [Trueperaceae bacterium]